MDHETPTELHLVDPLTGLGNRRALDTCLTELKARDPNARTAYALLDVDGFKAFNDRYGHDVGDEYLTTLGQRIQNQLRPGHLACRHGGNEFTIVLSGVGEVSDARDVLELIRAAATLPLTRSCDEQARGLPGLGIVSDVPTVRIGATIARPRESGHDAHRRAYEALLAAARAGGNCVRMHPVS